MYSRLVNDRGLNGAGPLIRGLLSIKARAVFCSPLGAADAEADHGRGSVPSHSGDRSIRGFWDLGGARSQSRSPTLNQRQCKVLGNRPYTQMFDFVEGWWP